MPPVKSYIIKSIVLVDYGYLGYTPEITTCVYIRHLVSLFGCYRGTVLVTAIKLRYSPSHLIFLPFSLNRFLWYAVLARTTSGMRGWAANTLLIQTFLVSSDSYKVNGVIVL